MRIFLFHSLPDPLFLCLSFPVVRQRFLLSGHQSCDFCGNLWFPERKGLLKKTGVHSGKSRPTFPKMHAWFSKKARLLFPHRVQVDFHRHAVSIFMQSEKDFYRHGKCLLAHPVGQQVNATSCRLRVQGMHLSCWQALCHQSSV